MFLFCQSNQLLKIILIVTSICIICQFIIIVFVSFDQQIQNNSDYSFIQLQQQFFDTTGSDSDDETPITSSNFNINNNSNSSSTANIDNNDITTTTTTTTTSNLPDYYIIFSTSCTEQQNWESWLFFYHMYRVNQRGIITRIVSGCTIEKQTILQEFHTTIVQLSFGMNYRIHFTPDFSRIQLENNKYPYKYMNKPYGVQHWLLYGPLQLYQYNNNNNNDTNINKKNPIPSTIEDGIVFLLDPDMVVLRPLNHDFTNEEIIFAGSNNKNQILTKIVKHGYPMSQQDGYLSTTPWSEHLNHSYIYSNQPKHLIPHRMPSNADGVLYWNTGPPYISTVRDMYNIVLLWCQLTPKIVETKPELFSEMYGYILATVQLQLKHTMIKSLAISETSSYNREGWYYIDTLVNTTNGICQVGINAVSYNNSNSNNNNNKNNNLHQTKLPIVLHYCSRYFLEKQFFSKYRIKKNIMNCNSPLLQSLQNLDNLLFFGENNTITKTTYNTITPPRADIQDVSLWKEQYNKDTISFKVAKRESFMICSMTNALNNALRFLKLNTSHCTQQQKSKDNNNNNKQIIQPNLTECYTVYNSPSDY